MYPPRHLDCRECEILSGNKKKNFLIRWEKSILSVE